MKFRAPTFKVARDPNEDGFKPMPFRMPTMPILREKMSRSFLIHGNDSGIEVVESRPGTGFVKKKQSTPNLSNGVENAGEAPPMPPTGFLQKKMSMPNMSSGADDWQDLAQSPMMKQVLKDLLQKTGTNLKEKGLMLESRMIQRKTKEARPVPKRSSRSFDSGDDVLERAVKPSEDEKCTSRQGATSRNTRRASKRTSTFVSPIPPEVQVDASKKLLSVDQVRAISTGAPCFSVEVCYGRYKPQVIFRGSNAETFAEFPTDYKAFGHPSFSACTLNIDAAKDDPEALPSNSEDTENVKSTIDLTEMPSMLSADGLDPGAVGFEHFLQLPIADDVVRVDESERSVKRKLLRSSPAELGLRQPNMEILLARLTELGQMLPASNRTRIESPLEWNDTKIEEMGVELFGKLLSSDMGTTAAGTGCVRMKTQIRALQKVLRTSGLWYDFTLVEWRTKVGQLLWEDASVDISSIDENEVDERDVLFLQITLAGELLLRINAVRSMADSYAPIISEREMDVLDSLRTTKIEWDLLLAQRFFENISISPKTSGELCKKNNRTSLFYAIPFLSADEVPTNEMLYLQPQLTPKNGEQQLAGLLHFAEALQWPHAQDLPRNLDTSQDMGEKYVCSDAPSSTYATPMSSPGLQKSLSHRSLSFDSGLEPENPTPSKTTIAKSVELMPVHISRAGYAGFEGCGWLSRSWLSGLVMPGEAASHFLMSTLLEHSPNATARLGRKANLYGGFIYEGRTYWSKSCVVGRVLAAKASATECMEWISVPELGKAQEDGWIDLAVKEMPDSKCRPRILNAEVVAKDSDLLHNRGLLHTARVGDFTWPADGPLVAAGGIICQRLSFSVATNSLQSDDEANATPKSIATITFGSTIKRKRTTVEIPMTYDVCFVSSYPCHPKTVKSTPRTCTLPPGGSPMIPFSPLSFQQKENIDPNMEVDRPNSAPAPTDSGYTSKQSSASTINFTPSVEKEQSFSAPMHPLHVDYRYDIVPVSTLFASAMETQPRTMSSEAERPPDMQDAAKEVMVLDCRGAEDLELFARAWCAQVGENAVIGKSGRTCLACCIREARALGICVVIRT